MGIFNGLVLLFVGIFARQIEIAHNAAIRLDMQVHSQISTIVCILNENCSLAGNYIREGTCTHQTIGYCLIDIL